MIKICRYTIGKKFTICYIYKGTNYSLKKFWFFNCNHNHRVNWLLKIKKRKCGNEMRKSFMKNKAPVLTGAVQEVTAEKSIRAIKNFTLKGAKGIDLHLTHLETADLTLDSLKQIISASPLPIFALNYTVTESAEEEEKRIELLLRAFEAGAAGIDMQGYTYDFASREKFDKNFSNAKYSFEKYNPKEVVLNENIIEKQCKLIEKIHAEGGEVLLSNHIGTFMDCASLLEFITFLEKRNPDTIKIVTLCDSEYELTEIVKAMIMIKKQIKTPVTLICNGKYRAISRILNALLGGYMVFCADSYIPEYANMGQPDITAIKNIIENANNLLLAIDGYEIN